MAGTIDLFKIPEDLGLAEYVEAKTGMVPRIYQRPILAALEDPAAESVAWCGPNQCGKSQLWEWMVQWEVYRASSGDIGVLFPSEALSLEKSEDLKRPVSEVEDLRRTVVGDPAKVNDGVFEFANGRKVSYKSAGTDLVALDYRIIVASEVDRWLAADDEQESESTGARLAAAKRSTVKGKDNLFEVDNRVRTWLSRGGKSVWECTPTLESYPAWTKFQAGSQGYYYLRCLGCGRLSIRSADVGLLQFDRDPETGDPMEDSIVLPCPECCRMHTESEAMEMVRSGGYVHQVPRRLPRRPSFQWGALAVPEVLRWIQVAEAIVAGGYSGSLERQKALDNTVRGLPLQRRHKPKNESRKLSALRREWAMSDSIRGILMAIDTQDDRFKWTVRSIDDLGNCDHVKAGHSKSVAEVAEVYNDRYGGHRIMLGMWDVGGHRHTEVMRAVMAMDGMLAYKGDRQSVQFGMTPHFRLSKSLEKLVLCNPDWYQADLLAHVYDQPKPEGWKDRREHSWTTVPALPETYHEEIEVMQAGLGKFGHEYRNWMPKGGYQTPHDYFDAEKMWFAALDYALTMVDPAKWIGGRLPTWWLRIVATSAAAEKLPMRDWLLRQRMRAAGK